MYDKTWDNLKGTDIPSHRVKDSAKLFMILG